MELFRPNADVNLLPGDGVVHYHGPVMQTAEADAYLHVFLNDIQWRRDEAFLYGKHYVTDREVAWYGDAGLPYSYSGTTKEALPWSEDLQKLREKVEATLSVTFNSCLLNLYHDGKEGMGWHSDDEKALVPQGVIASISLGAERDFRLQHKETKESVTVHLEHGSLLVMKGATQTHWRHCLPKRLRVSELRINLTFRQMLKVGRV